MPTVRMRQRCECQQCECDSSAKDDSPNCAKPIGLSFFFFVAKTFATFYLNFWPKIAHNSASQHLPRDVKVGIHSFLCGETFHTKKTAKNCLIKIFLCKNAKKFRWQKRQLLKGVWTSNHKKSSFLKVYGELLFFSFLPGLHIKTIFSFSE